MENATYATLTRQAGLLAQMQAVANNIANADTAGFKAEGVTFTEVVRRAGDGPSLSMAAARVRETALVQGSLERTGGAFDLAIEGDGFFLVETPQGPRLTRAGQFGVDPAPAARVLQGFLEESNVDPVLEVARMIEVSRAYEAGQSFLEREDERIRKTIQAIQVR